MRKLLINTKNHVFIVALTIIGIVIYTNNCRSQGYGYDDEDYILPHHTEVPSFTSPEVAGLGKYVDIPVNLYTGVPEISIPLYEINLNGFSLPINLSYHSSGIKIEEVASWVGLGWSLNAGGVITRAVKGIPDDQYEIENLQNEYGVPYDCSNAGYLYSGNIISDYCEGTSELSEEQFWKLSHGGLDGEPDIFYFNFLGYLGKFVLDHNGSVHLFEKNNFDITITKEPQGFIDEFVIITGDGVKVVFNNKEILEKAIGERTGLFGFHWNGPESILSYPSAWHITRIEFPYSGDIVHFQYEMEEISTYKRNRQEYRFYDDEWDTRIYNDAYLLQSPRLKSITWKLWKIDFDADHVRQDYGLDFGSNPTGAKALTKMTILDANENPIRSYVFNYSYFSGNTIDNELSGYSAGYSKRLRLDNIYQESTSGLQNGTFIFDYDNTPMPHRFSYEQDYWGYYNKNFENGLNPNKTLLPNFYEYPWDGGVNDINNEKYLSPFSIFQRSNSSSEILHNDFGNRDPNLNTIQACILTKITYPTGGSHEYIYQPNKFYLDGQNIYGGGVRIWKTIAIDNLNPDNKIITEYLYTTADNSSISSGRVIYLPQFVKGKHSYTTDHTIFSTSLGGLGSTHGSFVGYEEVTVIQTGNGKKYYKYNLPAAFGEETADCDVSGDCIYNRTIAERIDFTSFYNLELTPSNFPFPPDPNYDWNRGQLLEQITYNNSNDPVKHIINEYQIHEYNKINSLFVKDVYYWWDGGNRHIIHKYGKYYYLSAWKTLWKTTEIIYGSNEENSITINTEYLYENPVHKLVTEKRRTTSDGHVDRVEYKYPEDITNYLEVFTTSQKINRLIVLNIVNPVIQIERFNDLEKIAGGINTYNFYNDNYNIVLPSSSYQLEGDDYELKSQVDEYDNHANPIQVHKEYGYFVTYLWGYNYSYPICKIENATYSEVLAAIGVTYEQLQAKTDAELMSIFNMLRIAFPNAFVTSYTYIPLIGMNSMTDPNGITTYYDYDELGRLETIIDQDGNIEQHTEYNYIEIE